MVLEKKKEFWGIDRTCKPLNKISVTQAQGTELLICVRAPFQSNLLGTQQSWHTLSPFRNLEMDSKPTKTEHFRSKHFGDLCSYVNVSSFFSLRANTFCFSKKWSSTLSRAIWVFVATCLQMTPRFSALRCLRGPTESSVKLQGAAVRKGLHSLDTEGWPAFDRLSYFLLSMSPREPW